ncbi:hypothetical protein Ciccas_002270 [Cichlidogyrus casuarinus]|uniref:Uncharacterized protein n=1 Tax=Cichlidogyrus casuarinus TaxID=1844966 RepID=A0ABD2QHQ3_9PLAT
MDQPLSQVTWCPKLLEIETNQVPGRCERNSVSEAICTFESIKNILSGDKTNEINSLVRASEGYFEVPHGLPFSFPFTLSPEGCSKIVENIEMTEDKKRSIEKETKALLFDCFLLGIDQFSQQYEDGKFDSMIELKNEIIGKDTNEDSTHKFINN